MGTPSMPGWMASAATDPERPAWRQALDARIDRWMAAPALYRWALSNPLTRWITHASPYATPSEEIALVVIDYDAAHGVLSVTKARVNGIDQDVTKTGEERRSKLAATDRQ